MFGPWSKPYQLPRFASLLLINLFSLVVNAKPMNFTPLQNSMMAEMRSARFIKDVVEIAKSHLTFEDYNFLSKNLAENLDVPVKFSRSDDAYIMVTCGNENLNFKILGLDSNDGFKIEFNGHALQIAPNTSLAKLYEIISKRVPREVSVQDILFPRANAIAFLIRGAVLLATLFAILSEGAACTDFAAALHDCKSAIVNGIFSWADLNGITKKIKEKTCHVASDADELKKCLDNLYNMNSASTFEEARKWAEYRKSDAVNNLGGSVSSKSTKSRVSN